MKLQHLAIIFVIIVLPITLIMSQYIQGQMETIRLQASYQKALNTATHDALTAFQVNSINNGYSTISDSKIRDVEASINTFYTSLNTLMNNYASDRSVLENFIPAVVFTLYDGYYINSSYENTYEEVNKQVSINEGNKKFQEGLHPYIYYSCKYNLNGKTIIVNYTLDNAITVFGDFGEGYETRSGYFIDYKKVTNVNEGAKTLTYDGVQIGPETLSEQLLIQQGDDAYSTDFKLEEYNYIIYDGQKIYDDGGKYFIYDNYKKRYLESATKDVEKYLAEKSTGNFESSSAFNYYYEAAEFSKWVEDKLGRITQKNVIKMEDGITPIGDDTEYLSVNTGNEHIFDISNNDPLVYGSTFNSHRMAVIRKSIETNLLTALANFQSDLSAYEFTLPVIDEENWYEITNKVSIISFMQGLPIGMKQFNGYSVISNTRNGEVIGKENIYIITNNLSTGEREYHLAGCNKLYEDSNLKPESAYQNMSFLRQTVKIGEEPMAYFYLQGKNPIPITACYSCVVSANSTYPEDEIIEGKITKMDWKSGNKTIIADTSNSKFSEVRKLYMTALARERYDAYQVNMESMNVKAN